MPNPLPPGQKFIDSFPRFGLPPFANRFPTQIENYQIKIDGDLTPFTITQQEIEEVERVEQTSDFHCVTTWSYPDLDWKGIRFEDFYNAFILSKSPDSEFKFVVIKAQDGYRSALLLEDLLRDNVMLATHLDGEALSIAHGAPIRLVAPDHYGYKNVKHVSLIEFWNEVKPYRKSSFNFMDHPRGRVAEEERAIGAAGRFFRFLYSFGIKSTMKKFDEALKDYKAKNLSP